MSLRIFTLHNGERTAINPKFVTAVVPYGESEGHQLTKVFTGGGGTLVPYVVRGHFDSVVEDLQD
ncbi:hypothetical protein [Sinorhizobium meliloti]|uniref:hypothetical protein n=1 Tax=Rhizobium meliloti TaxID=382 RepID=UPI000FDBE746|nr:hypothetical protein [Sinorhizobium meliloti]RVP24571.1 hypothetical protein CN080_09895 [Sinorhizobium meliloti]RVP24683.1 hypothetical protein CN080_10505 [Sinorhizobium meliloti]